jgi:hypothetical protein
MLNMIEVTSPKRRQHIYIRGFSLSEVCLSTDVNPMHDQQSIQITTNNRSKQTENLPLRETDSLQTRVAFSIFQNNA